MSIKSLVKKYFKMIFNLCLTILISSIFNIVSPFILEKALKSKSDLFIRLIIYFVCIALVYGFNIVYYKLKKSYAIKFRTTESLYLTELVTKMKYDKIIEKQPTYLINRINEAVSNLYNLMTNGITQIVTGVLTIITIIILMYRYNTFLMGLYIIYSIISFAGYKRLNKILLQKSMRLQDVVSTSYKNILSFMTNVDFIKLIPNFNYIKPYLKKFFKSSVNENAEVSFYAEVVSTLLQLLLTLVQSSIYIYVLIMLNQNKLDFAQVAVIILLNNIYKDAMTIVNTMNISLRDVKASINFINTVIMNNIEDEDEGQRIDTIRTLEINAIDISYGDNLLIQSGLISCKSGDIIGISGESGMGKSTLIKYIVGLYENEKTTVYYNGHNLKKLDREGLKERISYISQNPSVFPITIKENILLGVDECEIRDNEIDRILSMEGFNKFKILGVDTLVLEGSANLSGGDKQKISIARLLMKTSDVLILDEFSNSLDKETESIIIDLIQKRYRNKIVIIITHDQELLKVCNKIYKLKNKVLKEIC